MAKYNYSHSYMDYLSIPLHLGFFIVILFSVLGFTWYINYESKFEDTMTQLKLFLLLLPILLLLVVHCLSSGSVTLLEALPDDKDSLHRAGGSPWGVGLVLIFLLFMISYQSSIQERWFPLVTRYWSIIYLINQHIYIYTHKFTYLSGSVVTIM